MVDKSNRAGGTGADGGWAYALACDGSEGYPISADRLLSVYLDIFGHPHYETKSL